MSVSRHSTKAAIDFTPIFSSQRIRVRTAAAPFWARRAYLEQMMLEAVLRETPNTVDVLVRARAGDQPAFAELVREHQAMVFGMALNFLRHRAEAEDLAQDVFVALHQNLWRVESAAHVKYWLCRVTSRRCIDRVRRLSWRREQATGRVPDQPVLPRTGDPMLTATLQQLVAELKPQARLVVTLRFQEDLQLSEIAQVLDMPINTVKSHLHRSLEILRSKLGERGTFDEA
jgi:RNA polymerase sigma-70 factor (ECF subfamily)